MLISAPDQHWRLILVLLASLLMLLLLLQNSIGRVCQRVWWEMWGKGNGEAKTGYSIRIGGRVSHDLGPGGWQRSRSESPRLSLIIWLWFLNNGLQDKYQTALAAEKLIRLKGVSSLTMQFFSSTPRHSYLVGLSWCPESVPLKYTQVTLIYSQIAEPLNSDPIAYLVPQLHLQYPWQPPGRN